MAEQRQGYLANEAARKPWQLAAEPSPEPDIEYSDYAVYSLGFDY